MFERGISEREVRAVLESGRVIEDYPLFLIPAGFFSGLSTRGRFMSSSRAGQMQMKRL
jgi:hypothetical protein